MSTQLQSDPKGPQTCHFLVMKLGQSSQNIFWIKNGWQHQALDTDLTEFLFYCIPVEYQLGNSCQTRPRFYGYNQCWMMTCFLGQRDLDNVDMLFDPWISHNFPMGFQKSYSAISWYIMVCDFLGHHIPYFDVYYYIMISQYTISQYWDIFKADGCFKFTAFPPLVVLQSPWSFLASDLRVAGRLRWTIK